MNDTLELVEASSVVVNDKRGILKDTYGEFLKLLHVRGGEAYFGTLREAGGYSRSQVHTRRNNLSDAGLITAEKREGYNAREEWYIILADDGETALDEWTEATEGVAKSAGRETRAVTVDEWDNRGERISEVFEQTEELMEMIHQLQEQVDEESSKTDTSRSPNGLSQSELAIVVSRVRDEIGVEDVDVGDELEDVRDMAEGNRWVLNKVVLPWMEWVEGKVTAAEYVAQSVDEANYFDVTLPSARNSVGKKFDAANPWKAIKQYLDEEV